MEVSIMKEKFISISAGAGSGLYVGVKQLMDAMPVSDFWSEFGKTLLLGVAGGLGGLLAKEIFNYLKRKVWQKRNSA